MQAIWKLRVGAEAYYVSQVASGLDEYYTGAGEAPGFWAGGGIQALGLAGEVDPADLRAVLAGLAPGTGLTPNGTSLKAHPRRVPGFDLTFAVPKSVSVAYALGDRRVQHLIVTACEAALTETLGWLEREACFVRRGTNKAENRAAWGERWGTRRMVTNGFVAAGFRHRTSRAGDPHLHWHVLVANLAQGIDGRWSALDGTAIYTTARTGGAMFQAAMRRELTASLGVEWGPIREDSAEIAGIPERVARAFSQRHEQIAEWLDTHGQSGPAATDAAQRATRTAKHTPVEFAAVESEWHTRSTELGWGPAELEQLLAAGSPTVTTTGFVIDDVVRHDAVRHTVTRIVEFDEWLDWLLDTRVTAHDGTFTRFDLTRAIAAELPTPTSIEVIEATVQRALASSAVVPVGDHEANRMPVWATCRIVDDDRELAYTTRSLLHLERQLLDQLAAGLDAGAGVLDSTVIEWAVAGCTLGAEQADAMRWLTSAGDRVEVLVGRAGTGKTHTLGALRAAYEAAGFSVIGLAPSARAACELEAGAGIGSTTIARHLVERREIDATTIVVIDEAGMAGVRDLARVIDQATRIGAKTILVGDHHQLPEVAAGGGFRAALDALTGRVAELTVNRRQHHRWEQAALAQLRTGDAAAAFDALRSHGRVIVADHPGDLHAQAIDDWQRLRSSGITLMLAGTRAEAQRLNRLARQSLIDAGELDITHQFEIAGHAYIPGDQVLLRHNDRHQHLADGTAFAVTNGMRGNIAGVDAHGLHVTLASGDTVVLDHDYAADGWVQYAYASTIHTVQGVTCDHVLVVGIDGLYREALYVALSRARLSAWIYTATHALDLEVRHDTGVPHPTESTDDPEHALLARMHASAAKTLTTITDPDAERVAALAATLPAGELADLANKALQAERAVTASGTNPADPRAAYQRAVEARTHLDEGRRVRALDRDNIGTVTAINDDAATCEIHFLNEDGRSATRTLGWHELVLVDYPDPVELTAAAITTLDQHAATVADAEQRWATELAGHGLQPGDADRYRRAAHHALEQAAHQLRGDHPAWLTTWLGPRPPDPPGAAVWDDTTRRIAHYRALHQLDHTTPGLGPSPNNPDTADHWQTLMLRTLQDRLWLTDRHHPPAHTMPARSPSELVDRRTELGQLMQTAPPDQRLLVRRLTARAIDPEDVQQLLVAATHAQDARRNWIIANWPHVVELEQINTVIANQPPLAQWPTAIPEPVQTIVDQLRTLAPVVEQREDRTLAELDHLDTERDPAVQLQARRDHLRHLATRTIDPAETRAINDELQQLGPQLRDARRLAATNRAFNRYLHTDIDEARATRITTLAHDTLTRPPAWLFEQLQRLHATHQLNTRDVHDLAHDVIRVATQHDRTGQPPELTQPPAPARPKISLPVPELG